MPDEKQVYEGEWLEARRLANHLGPYPSLISDTLKVLIRAHGEGRREPDEELIRSVKSISRSQKLLAPIISAAAALSSPGTPISDQPAVLLQALGPGLLSVILAFVFVHRRVSKLSPTEDWQKLTTDLLINMELGHALGLVSKPLGPVAGMLLGGIRHTALSAFMLKDNRSYTKYRLRGSKKFDLEFERSQWNCEHPQVAAFILADWGFRKDVVETAAALRKVGIQNTAIPEELTVWRSALVFIDQLKSGICPPSERAHVETLKIPASAVHEGMRARYSKIRDGGSSFSWMLRTSKETS